MALPASALAPVATRLLSARLVALWALSEALLGGVLHALKLPVTGLLVGGVSVVLLQLLGYYARRRGTVLRALLVVLTLKALLSPHSPPTAYVAVAFQGLLAEVLSWGSGYPRLRGLLLGGLTLLESAGQRALLLWLLFGNDLPTAFNALVQQVLGPGTGSTNYAGALVVAYLGLHGLSGLVLGWWAGSLPARLPRLAERYPWLWLPPEAPAAANLPGTPKVRAGKRRWRIGSGLGLLWLVVAALWAAAVAGWPPAVALDRSRLGGLLLRSVVLYGGWTLLAAPLLLRGLRGWLTRPRGRWGRDLAATLQLLPGTRRLVRQCWRLSGGHRGLQRLRWFARALAVNLLVAPTPQPA
ncbi:hypothetical protein [Hymenobacter sp. B81]|uniref:hypothetical protein n=1 Tax=Hymenobacter sp. B81 TaxID=3344878 RepID=UPI0037DD29F2